MLCEYLGEIKSIFSNRRVFHESTLEQLDVLKLLVTSYVSALSCSACHFAYVLATFFLSSRIPRNVAPDTPQLIGPLFTSHTLKGSWSSEAISSARQHFRPIKVQSTFVFFRRWLVRQSKTNLSSSPGSWSCTLYGQ